MTKKIFIVSLFWALLTNITGCNSENKNSASPAEIKVSAPEIDSAEPAIAADASGNIYVVYVEHNADKSADLFLQKFDNDQKPIGGKVRVNSEKGQVKAWFGDPPTIKVGSEGTIYIGWTARVAASEDSANDLYLSTSNDGGKTFNAPVKVNDDKLPAVHGMHSLEVDKNGRIYFAWLDERYLKDGTQPQQMQMQMSQPEDNSGEMKHQHADPNREIYFAASTDGGKTFSPNKKLAGNVCPCCKTSMITAPNGRLYVSWRQVLKGDFRHIAVAVSADNGASFGEPRIVSDDKWQINACPVSGAALAIGESNKLKIAWFTAGEAGTPGLYWAQSSDGGISFAPRHLLSAGAVSGTPVLQDDISVWSVGGKSFVAQFDAAVREIGEGDLPAATIVDKDRLFVASIKKRNGQRSVEYYCVKIKEKQ